MEVYLDNSATTRAYECVRDIVGKVMCEDYGNPSSMHKKGVDAEAYVREAKETLAKILKVQEKELYFTSGGTESDNLALIGGARANHRAVMYVNNEVGSVQPIAEASAIVKAYNKNILFHVDAVQGFGKYKIYPKKMGIDMLSVSGHKIHGPKGIGFIYINEKAKVKPIIFGGEQQKNMRSGTENVPGIAGIGLAAKTIYTDLDEKVAHMRALKQHFIEGVQKIDHTVIHGLYDETSAPHIISVGFAGIRSEVLLHTLEEKGIYVSSGSACASNHPAISGVLKGIGAGKEYLDATLRFSMSEFTTEEEIDYTLETLYNCVPMLRKYTRH